MNGVIDLDESSDSDGEIASKSKLFQSYEKSEDVRDVGLKKEETTEEKMILDDVAMTMNSGDCDTNLFPTDPNDQFPFNFDDKLPEDVLHHDGIFDAVFNKELTTLEKDTDDSSSRGDLHTEVENDDVSTNDVPSDFPAFSRQTENENEDDQNANEETSERAETEDHLSNEPRPKGDGPISKTTDSVESENKVQNKVEGESIASKDNEESEKDGNEKESGDSETIEKRPSSRESTTSTTSSSSERITIRSTSQLNQLVSSNSDVKIKTEKEPAADRIDKPGLSVLNPSQLGASENTSGENLLQNNNFVPSADQMMGYMPTGLTPLTQCDVCDIQCADSVSLDEHRVVAGHYKCRCSVECATFIFPSQAELSAHHQTAHGLSPVQQLAHQVQSIPMRYLDQPAVGNNYQTGPAFATANQPNRGIVPQMLASGPNNVQMRQFNASGSPRIGGVRSVPTQQQTSNAMKRVGPPLQQPPLRQLPPSKRRCVDNFSSRNGDTDCKVVSVQKPDNTDDVVAQLSKSITITARQETQKKNDTTAVANMLANRGITVSSVPTKANKNNPVAMLNLNSAVSLIPTNANSGQNRQNSGFAVPQSRVVGSGRQSLSGPISQTVDLTGPETPRTRTPVNRAANRFTCRICDRQFYNQEQLNQHMTIHRSGPKKQLPYKCPNCAAQYPTQQALTQHRQVCRRDTVSSTNEMVIPIVDLKHPGALQRLQSIGINHMIPLNALGSQAANGTFGIPILAFSSDRVANTNMANIGISNILPVGPLRRLGNL